MYVLLLMGLVGTATGTVVLFDTEQRSVVSMFPFEQDKKPLEQQMSQVSVGVTVAKMLWSQDGNFLGR